MKVRYICSCEGCTNEEYLNANQFKSKIHEYPDKMDVEKLSFDAGVWTIDVAEEAGKEVVSWSYEIVEL